MSDGILFVQCDDCGLRFHVVYGEELDAVLPGQYCPRCACPDLEPTVNGGSTTTTAH